jgi:RHS repeat-associated protein
MGNLTNVNYLGGSPSISFAYDPVNRMTNMIDASGTNSFGYTPTGQIQSETNFWISNTFNDTISYAYNQGHRTNLNLTEPSGSWSETYGYDSFWRFATITSPAGTFGYQYVLGAQSLISAISLANGSLITNSFDANARLTGTALVNSFGGTMDDYQYLYNQGNQRTSCLRAGGIPNYVNYSYDPIGEVTSDLAYESISNTLRNNEQLYYLYDAAGNLQYRTNNALIQNFQVNSLNELTSETNGGRLTVVGTTTPIATNVTVNSSNAVIYGDSTFAATNMPLTNTYTALALGGGLAATNAVTFNLASNSVFQYDGNGNLTSDGWRNFVYDDENQLIQVSVPDQWMSQFVYDGKKRRRIRAEFNWQSGAWVQTNEVLYVYDGNLAIQERASNDAVQVTYTRGRDMSGSLDGAGGIGGLLGRTDTNGSTFYHADANGNVTMLLNSSQAVVAKYLYDAFGNLLSESGSLAAANRYQFSSKEKDSSSGLIYYLWRFSDPNLQRWINRDPTGERGSANLYRFINNSGLNKVDALGLCPSGTCDKWTINVLTMQSGDIGIGGLVLNAELIADPSCCIVPHTQLYKYVGVGIGGGFDWTATFKVGSATFNTSCIPWNAHNGFGRVSGAGFGIIYTYGVAYLTTPQAYVKIASPSWGIDFSDFTTVGHWTVTQLGGND